MYDKLSVKHWKWKKVWFYQEKREDINEKLTDIIGNVLQLNCQNRSRKNVCGPWSK